MLLKKKTLSKAAVTMAIIAALVTVPVGSIAMTAFAAEEPATEEEVLTSDEAAEGETAEEGAEGSTEEGAEGAAEGETGEITEEQAVDPTLDLEPEEEGDNSGADSIAEQINTRRNTFADEAVMQIQIGYEFDDGSFDEWARGTGFLIGNRYLMTAQLLVDTSVTSTLFQTNLEQRGDAYRRTGINLADERESEMHIVYRVVDTAGNMKKVEGEIIKNGMGLVILSEAESIATGVFADSETINTTEGTVVGVKFAGDRNDKCQVQSVKAIVNTGNASEAVAGFTLTADTSLGNPIGAPVLNDAGSVIGMITGNGEHLTCLTADAIETFLSMQGVTFRTEASVAREQRAADDERARLEALAAQADVVDRVALKTVITDAQGIDRKPYTEETLTVLDNAIKAAQLTYEDQEATQVAVNEAIASVTNAKDLLKEKSFFQNLGGMNIFLIILAVLGLAAIGFVMSKKDNREGVGAIVSDKLAALGSLFAKKGDGKKKEAKAKSKKAKKNAEFDKEAMIQRDLEKMAEESEKLLEDEDEAPVRKAPKKAAVQKKVPVIVDEDDNEVYGDADLDETVRTAPERKVERDAVLPGIVYAEDKEEDPTGELSNEDGTTVLTQEEEEPLTATLTRVDDGTQITITDGFTIGKEKKKVDYCILNNSAISRVHAKFIVKGDDFYVEDQKSTNYTYINGAQIPEHRAVFLSDGSTIKLADVEFTFSKAS